MDEKLNILRGDDRGKLYGQRTIDEWFGQELSEFENATEGMRKEPVTNAVMRPEVTIPSEDRVYGDEGSMRYGDEEKCLRSMEKEGVRNWSRWRRIGAVTMAVSALSNPLGVKGAIEGRGHLLNSPLALVDLQEVEAEALGSDYAAEEASEVIPQVEVTEVAQRAEESETEREKDEEKNEGRGAIEETRQETSTATEAKSTVAEAVEEDKESPKEIKKQKTEASRETTKEVPEATEEETKPVAEEAESNRGPSEEIEDGVGSTEKAENPKSEKTEAKVSFKNFMYNRVVYAGGNKFTYYSETVLPGRGLKIPGRHVDGGYVKDEDGYIVVAVNGVPRGTIVDTPFGAKGKVYDRGDMKNNGSKYKLHIDVYVNSSYRG